MIRKARVTDLDELLRLYDELRESLSYVPYNKTAPTAANRRALVKLIKDPKAHMIVVARGKTLLACCTLNILDRIYWDGRPWAVLNSVVIEPSESGRGWAQKMIDHAVKISKKLNCSHLTLLTDSFRRQEHRFYTGLGFEKAETGLRMSF